ncbi:MAG: hypothetical protein QOG64_2189 [Acidimicrobiaceae bacterium]|nr:hypothetical protein [Acidimicrobiaceae bacterium]
MHPIERLRYVARASGAEPSILVRETAAALAGVAADDAVGLVPACRRLVDRHITTGPMWWLAARMLTAADPIAEAWVAADEIDRDPTSALVARELPDEATVTLIGWPPLAAAGLRSRGDLEVLVIDTAGDGSALVRRLEGAGVDAVDVAECGLAAAVTVSDLLVIEALAAGPPGVIATAGSHAAAAVARHAGTPVWLVSGVGRVLPVAMWDALTRRLDEGEDEPWDRLEELVPSDLVDAVIGPEGLETTATGLARTTCPIAPELLRAVG